jgi:hypothetical protein
MSCCEYRINSCRALSIEFGRCWGTLRLTIESLIKKNLEGNENWTSGLIDAAKAQRADREDPFKTSVRTVIKGMSQNEAREIP